MRIFTILVLLLLFTYHAHSQNAADSKPSFNRKYTFPRAQDYDRWDIGGHFGITYPYTDISASSKRNFALGIDFTKYFTHSFALQARILHGSLSGIDENKPDYQFNTSISYDMTLNALFQFGNISFLEKDKKLSAFASIGIGIIHFTPTVFTDGGYVGQKGVYSQYTQPLETMDYSSTTNLVVPIGLGLKYRISDRVSVTGEYSFRPTNSDKLDGYYKLLSSRDNYSYFGIGAVYHLGHKAEVLQWVNPMQTVYDDMNELKTKIIQLTMDSDKDGVPDINDKEPNTPLGNRVYGDGTTVQNVSGMANEQVESKPPVQYQPPVTTPTSQPSTTESVPVQQQNQNTQNQNTQNQNSPAVVVPVPDINSQPKTNVTEEKKAEDASTLKAGDAGKANDSNPNAGVVITQTESPKDSVKYIPDLVNQSKPLNEESKAKISVGTTSAYNDSVIRARNLFPDRITPADSIYRARIQNNTPPPKPVQQAVIPTIDTATVPKTPTQVVSAQPPVSANPQGQTTLPVTTAEKKVPETKPAATSIDTTLLQNFNDLPSIYFQVDETKINDSQVKTLEYVAMVMQNNPTVNFTIIGICDGSGSLKYNILLGKKRAESVMKSLVTNYHIDANRLSMQTLGAVDSAVKGSASMNRRVDIKVRN